MASQINPALLMQFLKTKMGGAGGAAGAATGTGQGDDSLTPATRELQGANPDYALKLISQIRKQILGLMPTIGAQVPAAARALSSTLKGFDATLKELQQAQATLQAVGGPIQNSSIPMPTPPGGGVSAPTLPNPANMTT